MDIFLGYSSISKAYRIFNKRTLVIEESMHLVFDESCNDISKYQNLAMIFLMIFLMSLFVGMIYKEILEIWPRKGNSFK